MKTKVYKTLTEINKAAALLDSLTMLYNRFESNLAWTFSVDHSDPAYSTVARALLNEISTDGVREVGMRSWPDKKEMRPEFNSTKANIITLSGHRVHVRIESEDGFVLREPLSSRSNKRIRFSSYTKGGRDAILKFIEKASRDFFYPEGGQNLFLPSSWGEWCLTGTIAHRDISTLHLANGLGEKIQQDLDNFLASEDTYAKLGIPWHRGYLFYGPPGTGKTTIAKVMSSHVDSAVYFIPLGDLKNDTNIFNLISDIPPRSILILEDVDVLSASHERTIAEDGESSGVTLHGLLNALDGIMTPHGLITVMTTNHKESLDQALIRDGRVDLSLEIGYASHLQAKSIWRQAYPEETSVQFAVSPYQITPAQIVAVIKRTYPNKGEGLRQLNELFRESRIQ